MTDRNYLAEAMAQARNRQSWNDRLAHWEKPASDSEEATIERAATMVRAAMSTNQWFTRESVQIAPQGSYYNNTNVRQEADINLRAVHRDIYTQYAPDVIVSNARSALGYFDTGRTYAGIASEIRHHLIVDLSSKFSILNVDSSGKKAIRVHGLSGSRAEVDIVPCFTLHHIRWNPFTSRYWTVMGVAILSTDGQWTFNFPDQHHDNGIAKRARTRHRFKRTVRMLKHLRDELVTVGAIQAKEVPSFLVECLVYGIDDNHFLIEEDDRYDRLLRIVATIHSNVNNPAWCSSAREINEIKRLFAPDQAWAVAGAQTFAIAAWQRLNA
jgi:hypothetical protein